MRKVFVFTAVIIWLSSFEVYAFVSDIAADDDMKRQIGETFEIIEGELGKTDVFGLLDKLNSGDFSADSDGIFKNLRTYIHEILENNYTFFFKILSVVLMASVLEHISSGGALSDSVRLLASAVIAVNLLDLFSDISNYCISVTDKLVLFVNSLIPLLITLVASGGNVASAGILNPVMLAASSVVSVLVKNVVMPLVFVGFGFRVCGAISGRAHITRLGGCMFSFLKWGMGFLMTVYTGVVAIIGAAAPQIDELTLKTAKYAVSSFVPYVGGMLSDGVGLVLNCSHILKNSVGILGLVGITAAGVVPCIGVAVKSLFLEVLSVVSAPIADFRTQTVIKEVASCVNVLLGTMVVVCVMYIVSVTVIIFVGGA